MPPVRRSILAASAVVASLAAPAAQADCCDSAGPAYGALSVAGNRAFLPVDLIKLETDQPRRHHGAVVALQNNGDRLGPTPIPSAPFEEVSLPALTGRGTDTDPLTAAWVQGPAPGKPAGSLHAVRAGVVGASTEMGASLLVGTTTTADAPGVVGSPDGSRLVLWRDGSALHARRIAAGGVLGPDIVVTTAVSSAHKFWLVGDRAGAAVIVWHQPSGMRALRVPAGADVLPAAAVSLGAVGAFTVLAIETDGAGGVNLVHAHRPAGATRRSTRLVQLSSGAAAPTTTVIASSAKGLTPSGALSPGAVAYLATGKNGKPDVFARILRPSFPPRKGVNVSRTRTSETGVSAVALGVGGRRVILYERRPKGQPHTDALLRSVAMFSKTVGREFNLSSTRHKDESDGRLAIATDGRIYAVWTQSTLINEDAATYTCDALRGRVMTPNLVLRPVRKLGECSVTSSS